MPCPPSTTRSKCLHESRPAPLATKPSSARLPLPPLPASISRPSPLKAFTCCAQQGLQPPSNRPSSATRCTSGIRALTPVLRLPRPPAEAGSVLTPSLCPLPSFWAQPSSRSDSDFPQADRPPPRALLPSVPPSSNVHSHPATVSGTPWPPTPFPAIGHSPRNGEDGALGKHPRGPGPESQAECPTQEGVHSGA